MKKKFLNLALLLIFLIALVYRVPNLNTPFWVDEFSTARNSYLLMTHGLGAFSQEDELLEHDNVTTHVLVGFFFQAFGITENSARIPFVLIGSLIPVLVYLVGKSIYDSRTGLASSILTVFSYFEITWSRQARSYVLQQAFILLSLIIYVNLVKKFSVKGFIFLLLTFLFGMLTHTSFILFIGALFLHFIYLCFHWRLFRKDSIPKYLALFLLIIPGILLLLFQNYAQAIWSGLTVAIQTHPNNLWYYHSFLWREQTIVSFLAVLGLLFNIGKYKKGTFLVITPVLCYLFFICFLFPPYVSRYVLPIFPLLIILAGYGVSNISSSINQKYAFLFTFLITFLIIFNGDTFVLKPKQFYSVNRDMREIALLDYDQVYNHIRKKTNDELSHVAIIDTWPDRARWYLGYQNKNIYYFHWENEQGNVNGLPKNTQYVLESKEKNLPDFRNPQIRFVGQRSDLELAMNTYPQGFIWIDDSSLPSDVLQYVKDNFQQELYLDHYELDENPYSIWPGTLYSWGFN